MKRQKVAKRSIAKATLAVEGPEGEGTTGELAPATGRPEEVGESGGVGKIREPASAARGLEEAGRSEEARGLEKAGGSEEVGGPKEIGRPERAEGTGESELTIGELEEIERLGEPVSTLLLSWSDCEQALALAATFFYHCFSFLNRLVLSRRFSSSSFLSLPTVITSSISPLSPQSTPVHPSRSFPSELYSALGGLTSKNLVSLIYMPMVRKIGVATFEVFSTSSCFNNFSKLLVVWCW